MNDIPTKVYWKGEPIEAKSKEELILIVEELAQMLERSKQESNERIMHIVNLYRNL